jgi:chemotaxis protein MotB
MFRSGEATLLAPSRDILRRIADVVTGHAAAVVVEGHTDDQPIHTTAYPSNWELSGARASSVVRFFLEQENALEPDDYVAIGYGEHHPKATNRTLEGRAKNRRVEILFSWNPWQNKLNASTTPPPRPGTN